MEDAQVFAFIEKGGVVALLLVFLVGGLREWWVFGTHYKAMRAESESRLQELRDDRNYWRSTAEELLDAARQGVGLAERRHQKKP